MSLYYRSIFVVALILLVSNGFAQKRDRDTPKNISQSQFDKLVDTSIVLLQNKKLSDISDSGHINLMMCLNTIFMAHDTDFNKLYKGGRYEQLEKVVNEKEYTRNITKVYPEWHANRGMGFYFPKLQMELYGTPFLYACFSVEDDFKPRKEAMDQFNKSKPVIEEKNNAIVDNPTPICGDINGDGKEDCIISYVLISKDGGNAIIGHESVIYVHTGSTMKMTINFPFFKFCYTLQHIKKQVIYAKEYECKPPYNTRVRERKFKYVLGKVKLIS